MKKALENLRSKNHRNYTSAKIYATHYYIKFTPKDGREYDILKSDSLLILYEHPLDVEEWIIPQTLALNSNLERPPIMWCAVKVDHKLPEGCPYEVLEHLYIPDEDKITEKGKRSSQSFAFAEELVDEALRISGNLKENPSDDLAYRRSKWRPAGKVRVWDDRARSYFPVVDVEVRARRWFTTHKETTNTQGNYLCDGRFRRPANYSIRWEKYHFSVRSGTFEQAKHNGPKQRGNWNPDYGRKGSWGVSDRQQYYGLIFQAARDYYYGNRFGLASPPRNSFWRPQTKIAADITARQNRKPSHAAIYARTGGIFPTIYIRTWNDNADRVYAVTAHELAHYSHWDLDREAFRNLAWDAYINGNDGDNAVLRVGLME